MRNQEILIIAVERQVKIRAADIDAPDCGSPFGNASGQAKLALVFDEAGHLTGERADHCGCTISEILAPALLPACSVIAGMSARCGSQYIPPALPAFEEEARATRHGLWRDESPVLPWERHRRPLPGYRQPLMITS